MQNERQQWNGIGYTNANGSWGSVEGMAESSGQAYHSYFTSTNSDNVYNYVTCNNVTSGTNKNGYSFGNANSNGKYVTIQGLNNDLKGDMVINTETGEVQIFGTNLFGDVSMNSTASGGGGSNPFTLLDAAGGLLALEDIYNNFIHNHKTYTTTKGIIRNYSC